MGNASQINRSRNSVRVERRSDLNVSDLGEVYCRWWRNTHKTGRDSVKVIPRHETSWKRWESADSTRDYRWSCNKPSDNQSQTATQYKPRANLYSYRFVFVLLDMHPLAAVSRSRLLETEPKLFVFETSYYAFCGRYCFESVASKIK